MRLKVLPGVTMGAFGRSGSCTCHLVPGTMGVSLYPSAAEPAMAPTNAMPKEKMEYVFMCVDYAYDAPACQLIHCARNGRFGNVRSVSRGLTSAATIIAMGTSSKQAVVTVASGEHAEGLDYTFTSFAKTPFLK